MDGILQVVAKNKTQVINNNPSLHLKHLGVPDGADGSDGTSYPLTENYTLPIAHTMGPVTYLSPLLCARIVVTYTHHEDNTYVTLFAGVTVMQ
jgi:hypothetical protein